MQQALRLAVVPAAQAQGHAAASCGVASSSGLAAAAPGLESGGAASTAQPEHAAAVAVTKEVSESRMPAL